MKKNENPKEIMIGFEKIYQKDLTKKFGRKIFFRIAIFSRF